MVTVPLVVLIFLIAGVVYFVGHDVEGQLETLQNSLQNTFIAPPDEKAECTGISKENLSPDLGEAGGMGGGVEQQAQASTGDNDGVIVEDATPKYNGFAIWVRDHVDLEGLMTKFKILLVLYQVGIP
jgi:hypothetical protein